MDITEAKIWVLALLIYYESVNVSASRFSQRGQHMGVNIWSFSYIATSITVSVAYRVPIAISNCNLAPCNLF